MNMSGHQRLRTLAQTVFVGVVAASATELAACSGPGAPTAIARSIGVGYAAFCLAALFAIPVMLLRFSRLGTSPLSLWPLLLLLIHPAWTVSATGGDCGMMLQGTAIFASAIWLPLGLWQVIAWASLRRCERHPIGVFGLLACVMLLSAAVITYFLPWTLNPPPVQERYLRYSPFERIQSWQDQYKREHGVFASSATQLYGANDSQTSLFEEFMDNGDSPPQVIDRGCYHVGRMLQGTQDDPLAWRTEGGLSNWAVVVRPVGFPVGHTWVQYLILSDGSVWAKVDPGTGDYLLRGVPDDPLRDGWRKTEGGYIRPEDLVR